MFAQNLCLYVHIPTGVCVCVCILWSNINTYIINERPLRPRAQNAYAKATARLTFSRIPPAIRHPAAQVHVLVFVYAFCG